MSKFVFVQNGQELDYSTRSVTVKKQITVDAKMALWKGVGNRLSVEELAALGIQLKFIPTQTAARLQYEHIVALYTAVPVFATRVAEWKAMYDELEIPYTATVAEIAEAEETKFDDSAERGDFHDRFMGKRTEVMVNYQAAERAYCQANDSEFVAVDDFTMWTDFATLVKYLPGTYQEKDIPALREAEVIADSAREAEINAELAAEVAEESAAQ